VICTLNSDLVLRVAPLQAVQVWQAGFDLCYNRR